MKHKLQTLLKHNWRTPLLLLTFIAISPVILAWTVRGEFNNWGGSDIMPCDIYLEASTTYEFKIENNSAWYGSGGTITGDVENYGLYSGNGNNCKITTADAGYYSFSKSGNENNWVGINVSYPASATFVEGDVVWLDIRHSGKGWGQESGELMYVNLNPSDNNTTRLMTKVAQANNTVKNSLWVYRFTAADAALNKSKIKFQRGNSSERWNKSNDFNASDLSSNNGMYINSDNAWDNTGTKFNFTTSNNVVSIPTLTIKDNAGSSTISSCTSGETVKFYESTQTITTTISGTAKTRTLSNPLYTYTFSEGSYSSGQTTANPHSWTTSDTYLGSGTAKVKITFAIDGNGTPTPASSISSGYAKESVGTSFTVNSACTPPTASDFAVSSGATPTYDGSSHQAVVVGSVGSPSTYNPTNVVCYYGANSSTTATSQTNAGTYNIYVHSADADGDYCAVTSTITTALATQLVISPVTPSLSNYSDLFSITGTGTHAYTGVAQSVAVAWKSPYTGCKGAITVKYNNSTDAPTNVGTYPITISVAAGTNNNASASDISVGTLTITKIDQPHSVTISNSGTHCIPSGGGSVDISASGGDTEEDFTYAVVGVPSAGISLSDNTISATNAGSITVTATRPGGTNYNDKTSINYTFTFVVTPTSVSVTPASPVTHTLPSSVATPSVTQSATATHTGNQNAWTLSPNYSVNTISDASATNPTLTFKREGVYTATVGVGCENTTDASGNSATITVEPPLTIYLSGTLVSSAQDAFGDNNFPMTRTAGSYVYTRRFNAVAGSSAAISSRKFSLRESNSSGQADYLIPKYAKVTYTNVATTGSNNDMYTTDITYSAGNTLEVRAEYKGYNSSENKPEWDISIGLVCDAPDSKTISISSESICRGSDVSVVVNNSQSGYIYTVYDAGNTQVGTTTGDGTNKSISVTRPTESTTYTVKAKQAASCTPTEMANTVSVTINELPTYTPSEGITQYEPVTVTSTATSPAWSFTKVSGSLTGAWLSTTSGTSTVFKAPTGTYTVSDGNCSTGNIVVSNDTETCD